MLNGQQVVSVGEKIDKSIVKKVLQLPRMMENYG